MKNRPNILWIVSDHQIHSTLPQGLPRFPLQKKMAEVGIEFTRAYTPLPVCSPARASMLTGLYPHVHGLTENDGRFGGRKGLDTTDWMIQQSLKEAGYRCGWIGKWHLHHQQSAMDFGFEGFSLPGYGYPYRTNEYKNYLNKKGIAPTTVRIEIAGESGTPVGTKIELCNQKNWFDYESGVALFDGPAEAHEAFFLADKAQRWLSQTGGQPFFLRVDTWGPHPPYIVGAPFTDMLNQYEITLPENFYLGLLDRPEHHRNYRKYWHQTLGLDERQWHLMYQRALEHGILVESALCALLDHVDLENTVVIFNSDHGDAVGSNGAVANKGSLMAEATMQIPLMMAGPGIPKAERSHHLVNSLDLVPTILAICNINTTQPLHGRSLRDLFGQEPTPWRNGMLTQHYGLHENIVQRAWYEDTWKLVAQPDGFLELYQLNDDPQETINLALQESHQDKVRELCRHLASEMQNVGDTNFVLKVCNS